eukprot:gene20256-27010_t
MANRNQKAAACFLLPEVLLLVLVGFNFGKGCAAQEVGDWIRGRATCSCGYMESDGLLLFGKATVAAIPDTNPIHISMQEAARSCGYTESDGSLPFGKATVAAIADANPDWPGSCGRCYEVKCVDGLIYEDKDTVSDISSGLFQGDPMRPILADIASDLKDEQGRSWPGNPAAEDGQQYTKCWSDKSIRVRIVDSCPCKQVDAATNFK